MLDDYTVEFQHLDDMHYGSIHTYVKVEEKCWNALCNEKKVHIICPVITLPLCKFWRWLRSSYPGTEKGQWFTTSLE